jgi:hypothetical protein
MVVVICVCIYIRSHLGSSMQTLRSISQWLAAPATGEHVTRTRFDSTYIPFQGRFHFLDETPIIDLTAMADRAQEQRDEVRPPDESFRDTLLPDLPMYGTPAEYRELESILEHNVKDMKRCADIIDNWKAIIPQTKLALDVLQILSDEAEKMNRLIMETEHLNECAKYCQDPVLRYGATFECINLSKVAHRKVAESFGIARALVEPLVDIRELDDLQETDSEFDETKMFLTKAKTKTKAKATRRARPKPQSVQERPAKRCRGKQPVDKAAEAESSQTAGIETDVIDDATHEMIANLIRNDQQLEGENTSGASGSGANNTDVTADDREVRRTLRRAAAETRAQKKAEHDRAHAILFPNGVPDKLPFIPDERFEGTRAICRITEDSDGTIRFNTKDGGVFWKDKDDEDGVNSDD